MTPNPGLKPEATVRRTPSESTPLFWYRKPIGTRTLSRPLRDLLDLLLEHRHTQGNPDTTSPSNAEVAKLYGCSVSHARRLIPALAERCDLFRLEFPDNQTRVIRWLYTLAGDAPQPASEPPYSKPYRTAKRKPGFTPEQTTGAHLAAPPPPQNTRPPAHSDAPPPAHSGAPLPLSENFEQETYVTLASPQEPQTPEADRLEPTNPTAEAATNPAPETADQRQARLEAYLDTLSSTEQAVLRNRAERRNPGMKGRPTVLRLLTLAEVEQSRPDLFPPLSPAPAAPAPPSVPASAPATMADRFNALASGRLTPEAVAQSVAQALDDWHSIPFLTSALVEVASGKLCPRTLAQLYETSKKQTRRLPRSYFGAALANLTKTRPRPQLPTLTAAGSH